MSAPHALAMHNQTPGLPTRTQWQCRFYCFLLSEWLLINTACILHVLTPADGCPADGVCDLRIVQPVCGIDDITYQSACLAACQGVVVAKPEPCNAADARQFPSTTPSAGVTADDVFSTAQTSVAAFEMNRCA